MAYSLPSFSAAANYAASYRPIFNGQTLADGYKGIKSEEGVNAMQDAVRADFLAKAGMAKNALQEFGALTRQELVNDAAMERLKFTAKENRGIEDRMRSDAKKAILLSLLGGGSGDVAGKPLGGLEIMNMLGGINQFSDNEITRDANRSGNLGIDLPSMTADAMEGLTKDTGTVIDPSKVIVKSELPAPPKLDIEAPATKALSLIEQILKSKKATPAK